MHLYVAVGLFDIHLPRNIRPLTVSSTLVLSVLLTLSFMLAPLGADISTMSRHFPREDSGLHQTCLLGQTGNRVRAVIPRPSLCCTPLPGICPHHLRPYPSRGHVVLCTVQHGVLQNYWSGCCERYLSHSLHSRGVFIRVIFGRELA